MISSRSWTISSESGETEIIEYEQIGISQLAKDR
jgi:hypothetical protein